MVKSSKNKNLRYAWGFKTNTNFTRGFASGVGGGRAIGLERGKSRSKFSKVVKNCAGHMSICCLSPVVSNDLKLKYFLPHT